MYILLGLENVTDFEGQSFALRLDIESAGYISEDIAQALCEYCEDFLT
uniref:Ribosome maturation factor RimP n=1 Tax=Angiostrongylus cantonensis TaxID=6313 RepID=A0A0K0D8H5_ANGCA